jgi:hypothetical protein
MRKGIGVICLVIGVLLMVKGHDVGSSVASQVKKAFTGAPVDKALQFDLAGVGLGLFGLLLIFWKRK